MGMDMRPLSPEDMRRLLQDEIDAGNTVTWMGNGAEAAGLTGPATVSDNLGR